MNESPPPNVTSDLPRSDITLEKYLTRIHSDFTVSVGDQLAAVRARCDVENSHNAYQIEHVKTELLHAIALVDQRSSERRDFMTHATETLERRMLENIRISVADAKALADVSAAASDRAIQKAEAASEKRFESVNEFRATLVDQTKSFAARDVIEAKFDSVEKKTGENSEAIASMRSTILTAGGAITIFLALLQFALRYIPK